MELGSPLTGAKERDQHWDIRRCLPKLTGKDQPFSYLREKAASANQKPHAFAVVVDLIYLFTGKRLVAHL